MIIQRIWAMPNQWTFKVLPIKELLEQEMVGDLWIDPFSGMYSPAKIRNDINPDREAEFHLDALDFLKTFKNESVDGVLFDPPYSNEQAKRSYGLGSIGGGTAGVTSFFSQCKDQIKRVLKLNGKAICFGWDSNGIGKKRGFTMTRLLLVPHGACHYDTICTVEKKTEINEELFP